MISIQFMGAAGTVTGSKYLVSTPAARVQVDCGLFQGLKELRLLNWQPPVEAARSLDAVVLTHAHLDHCGALPLLAKHGFQGPVYTTPATIDLCGIILPDSGHLQEEQAEHANRHGYSKHNPALPLYTTEDAESALSLLTPCPYGEPTTVADGVRVRLLDAGHILGSSIVEMWVEDGGQETKLVFSGDLGRYGEPLLADPTPITEADYLLVESTYGDRIHADHHPEKELAEVVREAVQKGGALLIPAFSVGRTQQLLYALHTLEKANEIPVLPVYVDSPMAVDATRIFLAHPEAHDVDLRVLESNGENPLKTRRLEFVRSVEDSKAVDRGDGPMIVISASGMATGGRVLYHLDRFLDDPRATVLFVGYQAVGTRGRSLLDGAPELKLLGHQVRSRAAIRQIDGFSAHADREEILRWLSGFQRAPRTTFLIHGEEDSLAALSRTVESRLGWATRIPSLFEGITLE